MGSYALLIGITRFGDPDLGALRAPESDVEALRDVLADPNRAGFSVDVSINESLLIIRDKISHLLRARHPSDMVLLYYSGHGIVGRGNSLYLATEESLLADPWARSLPASELQAKLVDSRAGKVVVVLDCCHSGVFTEGHKGAPVVTEKTFDPGEGSEGYYVLAATNAMQYAFDAHNAKNVHDDTHRQLSYFTSWIVEGLATGAAAPGKACITLDDLFVYVSQRARRSGLPMTPQRYVRRNSGEIIIAKNYARSLCALPDQIVSNFHSADSAERLLAVAQLTDAVSMRPFLLDAARDLLSAGMGSERDLRVRRAIANFLYEVSRGLRRATEAQTNEPPPSAGERESQNTVGIAVPGRFSGYELGILLALGIDRISEEQAIEVRRAARARKNSHRYGLIFGSILWGLNLVCIYWSNPFWWFACAIFTLFVGLMGLWDGRRREKIELLGGKQILVRSVPCEYEKYFYRAWNAVIVTGAIIAITIAIFRVSPLGEMVMKRG